MLWIMTLLSQHKVTTFLFPLSFAPNSVVSVLLWKTSQFFFCLVLLFIMSLATGLEMRQLLICGGRKKIKMVDPNIVLLDVVIVKECNVFFCYLIHMLWKIPGEDEWLSRREISPRKCSQWEKYIPLSIICPSHVYLKSIMWECKAHSWIHSRKT